MKSGRNENVPVESSKAPLRTAPHVIVTIFPQNALWPLLEIGVDYKISSSSRYNLHLLTFYDMQHQSISGKLYYKSIIYSNLLDRQMIALSHN